MDQTLGRREPVTFNSPLEAGIRAVAILAAAYPRTLDLQRMIAFDHLLVHTGEIGGPASLHPEAPLQSGELLVRRRLVEHGLLLMMTRHLVERELTAEGIRYRAGENAAPFIAALESPYLKQLSDRAQWVVGELADLSESEFRTVIHRVFDRWVEQFQADERSSGVEP